ncbi:phosphatase PAP2 family protein [Pararhizobium sp. PWRC1-1]|uniref:phosphatase PAP2 family protein n=1 Tax=Pararhizobium sp. PWRC1-1 TaxID=2804566 RepID=UPI003CEC3547
MSPFHNAGRTLIERIRAFELTVLILFGVISGGAFLFFTLASEVLEGETRRIDEAILLSLRQSGDPSLPIGPGWVGHAVRDVTSLGGTTVLTLVTLITIGYLLLAQRRRLAILLFLSVTGGWLVSHALKLGVARPRPDIVAHLTEVNDLSFPSGHAMLSAVTYLTIAAILVHTQDRSGVRMYIMLIAVFLSLLIGLSRIYLGVHYPTDVLAGWCAGAAWASLCWLVGRWYLGGTTNRGG